MRKLSLAFLLVAAMSMLAPALPAAAAKSDDKTATSGLFAVSIGTRWKYWEQTSEKAFWGSITEDTVDETQEAYPTNLNIQVLLNKYFGFVGEFDYFSTVMEGDGALNWQTLTFGVTARLPIGKRFVPYVVLGVTYNTPEFDENHWWNFGFPSQNEYNVWMAQRPADTGAVDWAKSYNHYHRVFQTDDAFGYTFGVGCDIFLTDNLALNFDVRWNYAEIDVRYIIAYNDGRDPALHDTEFQYKLDTISYAVGLRWYFWSPM